MNLKGYRTDYYELSGKASDIARQASFAGIALIWIFKDSDGGPLAVPASLLLPAMFFVVALFLDLLQYIFGAVIWGWFSRYHEKKGKKPEAEIKAPRYFNWPALVCFWFKLLFVISGYYLVFSYIRKALQQT